MTRVPTAIPPDVAKTVTLAVEGTLVARPLRVAARVGDAVRRGTFQNFTLGQFSDSLGVDTIVPWLMVCLGAAWTVKLVLFPQNAPIPVMFFALEITSVAVRPPSLHRTDPSYLTSFTSSGGI